MFLVVESPFKIQSESFLLNWNRRGNVSKHYQIVLNPDFLSYLPICQCTVLYTIMYILTFSGHLSFSSHLSLLISCLKVNETLKTFIYQSPYLQVNDRYYNYTNTRKEETICIYIPI